MSLILSGDSPNFGTATITTGTVTNLTSTTGTVTTLTAPTSTITTLNAPSGVLATQNGMTGIAKAWVNFAGSGGAINGSFNVSSITVNGTGDYTVNITTALPNSNYSVVGSGIYDNSGTANQVYFVPFSLATTSLRMQTRGQYGGLVGGTLYNPTTVCVTIFSS